jgi:hypothetical protein
VSRFLLSSAGLVCLLVAVGCTDDNDFDPRAGAVPSGPPSAKGTLVFDWSIEGRQDADACVEVGATTFDAIIVDEGYVISELTVPCEDFAASIDLYVDDFLARSSLLDDRRFPALGRVIEDLFIIEEGRVTQLVMDFPSTPVPRDPAADAGAPPPGSGDAGSVASPDAAAPDDETPPGDDEPGPDDETPDAGAADAAP